FITFCFIWVGIVIYVISQILKIKKRPQSFQYQN
ncbi:EamA family transporter RarD, partial [Staphylococcus pseudintermedius]|nr:EamA family transporter RarD [Staphylococcus pseudintermedius]